MNIVIVWEQYSWGGVDSYLKTLLTHWPDKSDRFTIISNFHNQGLDRILKDLASLNSVSVKKVSLWSQTEFNNRASPRFRLPIRIFTFVFFPLFLIQNFFQLRREFQEQNYDVLISQNGAYPGGWSCLMAMIAASIEGIRGKVLVIHHSTSKRRKFWNLLETYIDLKVVKHSDRIVAVSKASLESYLVGRELKSEEVKSQVIYNGVELTNRNPNLVFIGPKLKIGLLGRCEERKGHFDLLEALNLLPDATKEKIHVYFVGAYEAEFKAKAGDIISSYGLEKTVTLTGYMPQTSSEIISSLDLLCCLTQDYEGFGLTVIEAMAVGTPVITTTVGALKEFIVDGLNAYVVKPSSPQEIADKIIYFIEHGGENLLTGGHATSSRFTAENMSLEYHGLIRSFFQPKHS